MLTIRAATAHDAARLATLIHELAEFERLSHECVVTDADILRDGFGPHPRFRALIAEWNSEPAGYALYFDFYSTFKGRPALFLEDLFVREAFRRKGVGKALFARVAAMACEADYFCVAWEVLDWNAPAIDFYRKLGAEFLDPW